MVTIHERLETPTEELAYGIECDLRAKGYYTAITELDGYWIVEYSNRNIFK